MSGHKLGHYDPYDFSDTDSDEEYYYDHGVKVEDQDVDMDQLGDEANSHRSFRTKSSGPSSSAPSAVSFSAMSEASNQSSYTSYDREPGEEGSRSPSPAASVVSMTDSIRTHMYRQEHGRDLNNYSEVYKLPADEEEWLRLEKQHQMFIDIMGAKYPPDMRAIMESRIPGEKKVLDLGCGNGSWIRDVAQDFPFCEGLAVDLVPIRDTRNLPPNVRSEVDDVNLGLDHFYGQYDVVHARLISSGVKDYQLLIERISRILKPGGLVELGEFDITVYNRYRQRIEVDLDKPPQAPYWARFMAHLNAAVRKSGGDCDAATHLWNWVTSHGAFENVTYRDCWIPTIPGNDEMYSEQVYSMVRDDISAFLRSGKPLLLGNGVSEEELDIIEQCSLRELNHSEEPQYTRLQCIWATKRYDYVLPDDDP